MNNWYIQPSQLNECGVNVNRIPVLEHTVAYWLEPLTRQVLPASDKDNEIDDTLDIRLRDDREEPKMHFT